MSGFAPLLGSVFSAPWGCYFLYMSQCDSVSDSHSKEQVDRHCTTERTETLLMPYSDAFCETLLGWCIPMEPVPLSARRAHVQPYTYLHTHTREFIHEGYHVRVRVTTSAFMRSRITLKAYLAHSSSGQCVYTACKKRLKKVQYPVLLRLLAT